MALQLHQIIDGFLKKWNVEWARNLVTVIISRQTKFPRFLVFFSCSTSEGPACQGADESRHGSWTKRGLISTSSKVRAQLGQTMQPPPFQKKGISDLLYQTNQCQKINTF